MTHTQRFENKTAVVTGAASGIGRAIALRLAREGAAIVATDITESALKRLADDITSVGARCETVAGDIANPDTVSTTITCAEEQFGGLDCLVNNAGVSGPLQRFDAVDPAEFDRIVSINLKPVWRAMQLSYQPMRKRGGGAILNVSSIAGIRPNRHHALYGMTKAAVISLTHHAAMDYAFTNIRVNCLCPGPVETAIFSQMQAQLGEEAYQSTMTNLLTRTLLNRMGNADEQAAAAAYLLSDEAAFVTGVAMPVDGGWSVSDGHTV